MFFGDRDKGMDFKSKLVMEICNISSSYSSCTHHCSSIRKPVFVDWYLILSVDEDAGIDAIRKRYHQLALQLHPDKNGHPKAEAAFKLVSEGYACLTDTSRRNKFDSERKNSFCRECWRRQLKSPVENYNRCNTGRMKSHQMMQALREVQNRIKEEQRVIESCLRANRASREGSPLFDPSDRLSFPGYPHRRTHIFLKPQEIRCESPLYQIRKTQT